MWPTWYYRSKFWSQQCRVWKNITNVGFLWNIACEILTLLFVQELTVEPFKWGLQCNHILVRSFVIQPWTTLPLEDTESMLRHPMSVMLNQSPDVFCDYFFSDINFLSPIFKCHYQHSNLTRNWIITVMHNGSRISSYSSMFALHIIGGDLNSRVTADVNFSIYCTVQKRASCIFNVFTDSPDLMRTTIHIWFRTICNPHHSVMV